MDNQRSNTRLSGNGNNELNDISNQRVLAGSPNKLENYEPETDPWSPTSGGSGGFVEGSPASASSSNSSTPKASSSNLATSIYGIPVSPNPFASLETIDSKASARDQITDFARKIKTRNGF